MVVGDACHQPCSVDAIHANAVRTARGVLPDGEAVERMVTLFAVLSNATRLRLLLALEPGTRQPRRELCVCDLAAVVDASQSMTSHQLRLLREAGLVVHRRAGKLALYRLADGPMGHLLHDALEHVSRSAVRARTA